MVPPAPAPGFAVRMAGVGSVVFLANAGLLVLQLVAGKRLSPFVGSSLSTWTAVIAAFLTGIAFGNAVGGRIADRSSHPGKLALFLLLGALASLWMIALPELLDATGLHRSLELGARIPVLAFALCFPAGFTLSLLTPMAIRICVPDVGRTGGVTGLVFALGTAGCLFGNYQTGFVLIPHLELNSIILAVAGLLAATAVAVFAVVRRHPPASPLPEPSPALPTAASPGPALPLARAFAIVFACSFAGMILELGAVRLLAQVLGVSLFTWTGVIGVMLAGTALGNLVGGRLADRAGRSADAGARAASLGWSLMFSGIAAVFIILFYILLTQAVVYPRPPTLDVPNPKSFSGFGTILQVVAWTFAVFFLPMFGLGLISPQVIRMAVPDVGSVGRVAGSVYAWSIAGAIAGTFATGYVLISSLGVHNAILLAAALPCMALLLVTVPRRTGSPGRTTPLILESGVMLYALAAVLGAVFGSFVLIFRESDGVALETDYYTIKVYRSDPAFENFPPSEPLNAVAGIVADPRRHEYLDLALDSLRHSQVDMQDPTYLHYKHEHFQLELVRLMKQRRPEKQSVLVIGGGGYTFPRCTRVLVPTADVDVVEIDPGVTAVAKKYLGLIDDWNIRSIHMDGRQFVAERARPGGYDLVTLDAVNDLSVPSHLMTREFNDAVKKTLTPDGVYLVTVIDHLATGKLWKAAAHTLGRSFAHVEMALPDGVFDDDHPERNGRTVIVLYASDAPLDGEELRGSVFHQTGGELKSHIVRRSTFEGMLATGKKTILTDQFSPTDNLMMDVFKDR